MKNLALSLAAAVFAIGLGFAGTASAAPKLADTTLITFADGSTVELTTSFCNVQPGDIVLIELFNASGGQAAAVGIDTFFERLSQATGNAGGKSALNVTFDPNTTFSTGDTELEVRLDNWNGNRKNGHISVVLDDVDEFGQQAWGVNLHKKDCDGI